MLSIIQIFFASLAVVNCLLISDLCSLVLGSITDSSFHDKDLGLLQLSKDFRLHRNPDRTPHHQMHYSASYA